MTRQMKVLAICLLHAAAPEFDDFHDEAAKFIDESGFLQQKLRTKNGERPFDREAA